MMAALQILVDALSVGSLYALATLGVGLVFGVLRLANFAYGDFITVASYALIVPTAGATAEIVIGRWPWPLLVTAVVGVVVILSLASEYFVFRPLRTAKPAVLMVGSFALGYIIQNIIIVVYDGRPKAVGIWPGLGEAIVLSGLRVPRLEILTIVVTLVLLAALVLFLKRSPFGVQMRAASEDFRMARMLGVPANTVIGTSLVISGFLAAVVSLLFLTTIFRWIQAYAEELEKRIRGGERARGDRSRRVGGARAADWADRRRTGRFGDAGGLMGGRRPSPPRERSRGRS